MLVHVLPSGPLQTNAYLLTSPERKDAVLIDAPLGIWAKVDVLLRKDGCELRELWFTHGHFDHLDGAAEIPRTAPIRVRAHTGDRVLFENPEAMRWFLDMFVPGHPTIEPVTVDEWLRTPSQFEALGESVEVRHVPGHAPGNVAFYFPKSRVVFVGDSLFARGIGRTDLPEGNFDVLDKSIREQLYTLPGDTVIYPGHGPHTTVLSERQGNPYIRP